MSLLVVNCLLVGCTQNFTVIDTKEFKKIINVYISLFNFYGLNPTQPNEICEYQVGKLHCYQSFKVWSDSHWASG